VKSTHSKGRKFSEKLDVTRTCFQRDRDRIIHSKSFRRLKHKTQVFISTQKDHVRSRLTHSIEVSQIARHMARLLRLNEDLTEAISLAHDLGHPPFGHAGEETLNDLMKNNHGFEHNHQSLRIVDLLESKYPNFPGLNLSFEVRRGILKHDAVFESEGQTQPFFSLEAQIVNLADEITYTAHDVDDALRSMILTDEILVKNVSIWRKYSNEILSEYTNLSDKQYSYLMNSKLITNQIRNAIATSKQTILQSNISTFDELQQSNASELISFSKEFHDEIRELKAFLFEEYYSHYDIYRSVKKGQMIIKTLFNALSSDFRLIPKDYYENRTVDDKKRLICDYISGMTDSFALHEYQELYS
ncbi:MAG: deoxyguanosinetriphosphate triphosphohydrolase, partial [Candidatus Margulisiibacteriota bacterium]